MNKTISIRQPWAWLIVNGYKDIENRSWPTNFRGRILIHAAKKPDPDHRLIIVKLRDIGIPVPDLADLPKGGIVGHVNLTDCITESSSEWFSGRYGFVLSNPHILDFIPIRGQLGIFGTPRNLVNNL